MAIDMFIKIGDVEGEAADDKHGKEIDVLAWSWGMSQSGTTHMGGGGGSGKVAVQDMSITKYVDSATNALMKACCDGTHYPEAMLTVRKAGKEALEYINHDEYVEVTPNFMRLRKSVLDEISRRQAAKRKKLSEAGPAA